MKTLLACVLAAVILLGACAPDQTRSTNHQGTTRSCHCKKKIRWNIHFNINHRRTPIRIHH